MTAPSIRQLLIDNLDVWVTFIASDGYPSIRAREADELADALLASPDLRAIIDLAASVAEQTDLHLRFVMSAEVRALLADWRASRAEQAFLQSLTSGKLHRDGTVS